MHAAGDCHNEPPPKWQLMVGNSACKPKIPTCTWYISSDPCNEPDPPNCTRYMFWCIIGYARNDFRKPAVGFSGNDSCNE